MKIAFLSALVFFFQAMPSAQTLSSEPDLYSALIAGEMDYDTYLNLKDLMENKPCPCAALDRLPLVPGITQEEMDTLERLCDGDDAGPSRIPPDLLEKIAPFTATLPGGGRLIAEYRLGRDLGQTVTEFKQEHYFGLRYTSGPLSALSQGRSDAHGQGYFFRNSVSLRDYGVVGSLQLGSFRQKSGLGLTFGGIARTTPDTAKPASFAKSAISPAAAEPFGAFFSLNASPFAPFALFSINRNMAGKEKTVRAAGAEFSKRGLSAGFILLSTRTPFPHDSTYLETRSAGLYGTLHQAKATLSTELSLSQGGYACEVKATGKQGSADLGLDARKYSAAYFNPAGRGSADFSSGFATVPGEADTLVFSGLRAGEWGGELFARFNGRHGYIRPSLFSAYSGERREGKTGFSVKEYFEVPSARSKVTAEQRLTLGTGASDTANRTSFSVFSRTALNNRLSFRANAKISAQSGSLPRVFARTDISASPLKPLNLSAGIFTSSPLPENSSRQTGLLLEEEFRMERNGTIRIYCTFLRYGEKEAEARTLGICCNLNVL